MGHITAHTVKEFPVDSSFSASHREPNFIITFIAIPRFIGLKRTKRFFFDTCG